MAWPLTRELYADILELDTPFILTDPGDRRTGQGVRQCLLATKISFINAIAEVYEPVGADVRYVADAIGYDARIGRRFLNAGIGFGAAACRRTSGRSRRVSANSGPPRP